MHSIIINISSVMPYIFKQYIILIKSIEFQMGCGTSLNESEVNQPKETNSEPQLISQKPKNQLENKENKQSKKENIAQSLRQVKTEKSLNLPVDYNQGNSRVQQKIEVEQQIDEPHSVVKRNPMDKLLLFGESSGQRKIVHFLPNSPNPSFEVLLSRSNNPPPMKYQPPEVILEESQQLCSSHLYSSTSHPPYNFMFAIFVDSDCSQSFSHSRVNKSTFKNTGLVFLCGGVNYDFDYLSDEAFLYNPSMENISESSLNCQQVSMNKVNKSPHSRKRRIGNNLMGSKFDRLPYMKTKRYSHMGVYYRTGKLKYIYVFGGRSQGDVTIKKCEKYSFEEKKWIEIAPMSMPRSTGFAMIINKKIYVFGGYTAEGKRSKKIERYNPVYDSWETLNYKLHRGIETGLLLPIPKVKNEILLVGGNVQLGGIKSVLRLNFEKQTYIWDSDLKKQRLLQKGLVIQEQNSAYIFGGDFADTVEKYSFKEKSWKILNNLGYGECISPDDINSFTMAQDTIQLEFDEFDSENKKQKDAQQLAAYSDQYKYIFGCDDYPTIYQMNTKKWVLKKKPVPMSLRLRCEMSILKIKDGKYFIAGGIDSYREKASKAAYIYYSLTNRAIQISKMHQKRYDFGIGMHEGRQIYVFGGHYKNGNMEERVLETCEKYDIAEDKWIQLPDMPRERRGCRVVFTPKNDGIVLIGGTDSSEQGVNEIDIFELKSQQWKSLKSIVPIPLQIRDLGILKNQYAQSLIKKAKQIKMSKQNFEFLEQEPQPQLQQQQQRQKNPSMIPYEYLPLLIFNYNSYTKQYTTIQLLINLTADQILEVPNKQHSQNGLFAYSINFSLQQLPKIDKQYDINESIQINSISMQKNPVTARNIDNNSQIAITENTCSYFISNKGVFKWKYSPHKMESPTPQIVINQIHLLSLPLQRFCIA